MCEQVQPKEVMVLLNALYSRYDAMLDKYGVYKVRVWYIQRASESIMVITPIEILETMQSCQSQLCKTYSGKTHPHSFVHASFFIGYKFLMCLIHNLFILLR